MGIKKKDWTDGQPFFKWWWKTQKKGQVLLVFIVSLLVALFFTGSETFDPWWAYYASISFFILILAIFSYKSYQHWDDLRKGRSR